MSIFELLDRLEAVHGRVRPIPRFEPMDELVSCILSQSSTDASSFPAFTRLKEQYPDWADVVGAGPERIAEVVKSAGLANSKANNIVSCLVEIHRRTGSFSLEVLRQMPTLEADEWLRSLPGVGPKTAAIVLCFAFGRNTIPVDTHVYRVCQRLGLIPTGIGELKAHRLLAESVPPGIAFRFHVTLIQHGRTICRASKPACDKCPVSNACVWFNEGADLR